MNSKNTILVLGASTNVDRTSNLAVRRLIEKGFSVLALGKRGGVIEGIEIHKSPEELNNAKIDTITMYLNANNQSAYYSWILKLNPRRIIFNPGAENPDLEALARNAGVETDNACTLVLLATGTF